MKKRPQAFKIYILLDPDTLEVRYVGYTTKSLTQRLSSHIYDGRERSNGNYRSRWIGTLLANGKRPIIRLVFEHGEADIDGWAAVERDWIRIYRDMDCRLTNSTDGGDVGCTYRAEVGQKISAARRGHKWTPEQRQRGSEGQKKRGKFPPEHRAKIAAALKGKPCPQHVREILLAASVGKIVSSETRAKQSAAAKRRPEISPETRAKLSAVHKGSHHTPESRELMRAAAIGRKPSDETRAKMSASAKARCEKRKPPDEPALG